jgi:NAD(P) transhydrogenase subunit alpha
LLIGAFNPLFETGIIKTLAEKKVVSFSLDVIPRTTRAQAMDVLSSMATVAGYKAVLEAARLLPRFFPMFMTAAGTIKPAKVLILGAGVAGLQAVATSRKLGAVVEVFDVRAAVKEEVIGLGARFVEVEGAVDDKSAGGYAVEQTQEFHQKQKQTIHEHAIKSDVIICTAQIPGKRAPLLISAGTVDLMNPGSVIIDLATSTGGNCELAKNGETIEVKGIRIVGNSGLAAEMPTDASRMFGKNVFNFIRLMFNNKNEFFLNWEDDLIRGTCVTRDGEIVHERVKTMIIQ